MKIESRDRTIKELLGSAYYVIPRFQRPYSWDSENVTDFWNDVVVNESSDYFIGSMVVYTYSDKLGVVDGQQRLTTIMILLSCVRDALERNGFHAPAQGLHKLIERENIENQKEFVLQTESSHPYFQDQILSQKHGDVPANVHQEEERIKNAHTQFKGLLNQILASIDKNPSLGNKKKAIEKQDRLTTIRDSVLSLKVIVVTLDSEDDAYLIFETLNTRGKDLALADLVKNHFTKLLKKHNKGLDQAALIWRKIRETVEGKRELDTDTFIYHWWLSKYDYTAKKKIYKEFRKRVVANNAKNVLDELLAASTYYRAIHDTDYWKWDRSQSDAEASLAALNMFRVRQQVPLALSLVRAYKNKTINVSQLTKALSAIEKFHFLFTAVTSQRSSGGISGMYALLARQIAAATSAQEAAPILNGLRAKLRERIPPETEFVATFPSLVYTSTISKERQLVKYALSKISRSLGHKFAADMDDLTIEHLVPQSKIDGKTWKEGTVGQLGNLLLVTKEINERLKDRSFAQKKAILMKGYEDVLPDYFWDADNLTEELVVRRTKEIAECAYQEVWRI